VGIIAKLKYKFKNLSAEEIAKEIDDPILRALVGNETITREKAMSIPSVSSNVDLISSMIASMPIKLYQDKGTKVEEIKKDYRIPLLNDETKDTLDSFQWKKALVEDYLMSKGGYSFVKWTRNQITGLYYVESSKVTPFKNEDPIHKKCNYMINSNYYKDYEIFRILRNTKDGVTGKSITEEISKAFETAFATMMYQLQLVKKGGNKKGFLTTDTKLTQEVIDKLKEAWKNMYLTNEENCVVLNKGMDFKESSNSSVEMQLDQSKNTLDKQIDKAFHIESSFEETFKKAILPIIKSFESSLNKYLLLEKEKKQGYFFEFDIKEITKANLKDRYLAYQIALNSGWLNRNEIRYEENRDKVEGLDTYNVTLGAVLYDPKTKEYFVPNTGQVKENGKNDTKSTENEQLDTEKEQKLEKNDENSNKNAEKDEPKGEEKIEEKEEKKKGGEEDEV
jgi:HK97 family phage portal protein